MTIATVLCLHLGVFIHKALKGKKKETPFTSMEATFVWREKNAGDRVSHFFFKAPPAPASLYSLEKKGRKKTKRKKRLSLQVFLHSSSSLHVL